MCINERDVRDSMFVQARVTFIPFRASWAMAIAHNPEAQVVTRDVSTFEKTDGLYARRQ